MRTLPHARRSFAAGSAAEVLAGLDLAVAWSYLCETQAAPAKQLLDRLLAVCWGAHRAGQDGWR